MVLRASGLNPVTESLMQWIQQQAEDRREDYGPAGTTTATTIRLSPTGSRSSSRPGWLSGTTI